MLPLVENYATLCYNSRMNTPITSNKIKRRCTLCGELGHRPSFHEIPVSKTCGICHRILPISFFRDRRKDKTRARFTSYCTDCDKKRGKAAYRKSFSARLTNLASAMRRGAARRNLACTIDLDYLLRLLEEQHSRCYYTDIEFGLDTGNYAISIERLNPKEGYIPGNVVLCCWLINCMKRNLSQDDFFSTIRKVLEHHDKI